MNRFAVIGAGIAGLVAARRLQRAGAQVVLFEKARGPGGRMPTRRTDWGAFDHGAQFFTARTPEFSRKLDDWVERKIAEPWVARFVELDGRSGEWRDAPDIERYVGAPRMSALARDLADGLELRLSCRVSAIEKRSGQWSLDFEDDVPTEGGFDAVIVATPPAQAVPLLQPSPAFRQIASSVLMLPCQAVMIAFDKRPDVAFDAAFVEASPLAWIARDASKPGRGDDECWVLHATPGWSRDHVDAAPGAVVEGLQQALASALGIELPPVQGASAHRWLYARASRPLRSAALWSADHGIGVCGDWLVGDRVEDGFMSGFKLAALVVGSNGFGAAGG